MRHQFRTPPQADIDAARVFSVRAGMLCGYTSGVTTWVDWLRAPDDHMPAPLYINTDDGATRGAMQEQIEDLAGCEVKLCDTWSGSVDRAPDGWIVRRRCTDRDVSCDRCSAIGQGGRTRGEALVSARRALSSVPLPPVAP